MRRAIRDKATGVELAAAEEPQVFEFEGNLYFDPDTVNSEALVVTTETYTCPYKGTCFWVDVKDGARGVAWVYDNPKSGYENIKGRYGFYKGNRPKTEEV
ncbi:MAG TPA: DUF427 domain-containing protein [Blastocatellia bacterium]|nr:DUF427 domain-containing protein [Blastocatellia bacterium]